MAVATKTDEAVGQSSRVLGLPGASLFATIYWVLAFVVIQHLIPLAFDQWVVGPGGHATLTQQVLMLSAMAGTLVVWIALWPRVFGAMPGLKAGAALGVALVVLTLLVVYLACRAVEAIAPALIGQEWLQAHPGDAATYLGGGAAVLALILCAAFAYKLFNKPKTQARLVEVEEQGWFALGTYKRGQGVRARRWTLIGLLLLIGTGLWVYGFSRLGFGGKPWTVHVPFQPEWEVPLLRSAGVTTTVFVGLLLAWLAYRVVNYPRFADFLIATDAEMNKVSWTTRKRLMQSTVVVLVTVALMSIFLLLVDLLWSFILTRLGVIQQ